MPAKSAATKGAAAQRWFTTAKVIAGTFGAYGVTALVTAALSLVMVASGMARTDAVTAATLASFAIFAGIAMAAFHAQSAARAWLWLTGVALPLGLLVWLLMPSIPA